jgi:hypothetical protein
MVLFSARSLRTVYHESWDEIDQRALGSAYEPLAHARVLPLPNGLGLMQPIMVG